MIPVKSLFSFPGLPLAYDLASWPFVTMAKREISTALADLLPDSRVLDVGTGTGVIARHLSATLQVQVTGVDLSPEMLARARFLDGRVTWVEGSAEDLPVHGLYDAVIASYLLRHIPPDRAPRVLSEMHRVLAHNGRLVLVDLQLPKPGPKQVLGVWSLYGAGEFIDLAQAAGFSYMSSHYFPLSVMLVFKSI